MLNLPRRRNSILKRAKKYVDPLDGLKAEMDAAFKRMEAEGKLEKTQFKFGRKKRISKTP